MFEFNNLGVGEFSIRSANLNTRHRPRHALELEEAFRLQLAERQIRAQVRARAQALDQKLEALVLKFKKK